MDRERPLRVLVAHNRYRSGIPSGENVVVEDEVTRLRAAGCDVTTYIRSSDEIAAMGSAGRLAVAAGPVYSPSGVARFAALLRERRPDIVHLHNPFPLLSPWIVRTAWRRGVPIVQTVHNHRHTCIAGTHMRDGHQCYDCPLAGHPLPGVRHRCYRGSMLQSAAMAVGQVAHRRTWLLVDRYLALNSGLRAELVGSGIPGDRVTLMPNTAPDPGPVTPLGRDVLFVGRLDEAKGVLLLLDAWTRVFVKDVRLVIVGDGPLRNEVKERAGRLPLVDFRGLLSRPQLDACYRAAAIVVVPSITPEAFGLVALEALAHGRPVVASRVGGLPEVVGDQAGVLAEVDPDSLAAALTTMLRSDVARLGAVARARYEALYSPEIVTQQLLSVYADVVAARRARTP